MGLEETDIFQDMNDCEKFASAIIPQKSLKEKLRDLIKEIVEGRRTEFLSEEEDAPKLIDDELL
jgi:hypothetical protein